MFVFRQLFDEGTSTYTYLLGDGKTGDAVLIDPVFEQVNRDTALLRELSLSLRLVLDTHCHADHITAAWLLRRQFSCEIGISRDSGVEGATLYLEDDDEVRFGSYTLKVLLTPGHTKGCATYVLNDGLRAFTGDTILIRGCGRTDFQEGNPLTLYRSVHEKIFALPPSTVIYPGHDYRGLSSTSVAEEREHNPRLGGEVSETDFVGYMNNLGLAYPERIDAALPANLVCGMPDDGVAPCLDDDWAPLRYMFAGFWEIEAKWLRQNLGSVQVVDVRDETEFKGSLGHIEGAILLPLDQMQQGLEKISKTSPVVLVCRSGSRSARAAQVLRDLGFTRVANLAGGMLCWNAVVKV